MTSALNQHQMRTDTRRGRPRGGSKPRGSYAICECGNHAFAPIGRGLNVLVSPEDVAHLQYRWKGNRDKGGYLTVARTKKSRGKSRTLVLAREILEPSSGRLVDHRNGDSLDNRRVNLRECSASENSANSSKAWGNVAVRGVHKYGQRYVARISKNGKRLSLGVHDTPEAARDAYLKAARALHGEFARAE